MTAYEELQKRRAEFKGKVLSLLKDASLSYKQIGAELGITHFRVYQIRKEFGLPNRIGGYPKPPRTPKNGTDTAQGVQQ
jgi:hypothetical protein